MKHYRDQTLVKTEQIKQSINYSISIYKHFICINNEKRFVCLFCFCFSVLRLSKFVCKQNL